MKNSTIESLAPSSSRRNFLRTASVAAAAGLALADTRLLATPAEGQSMAATTPAEVQLFTAGNLDGILKALHESPANKTIVNGSNFVVLLTVETAKSAEEFEFHENRDHVFYVLDGNTTYELGGTPKGSHGTGPGEWLAPESAGATKKTLNKGDMLVIPRGTPHKRITEGSVTLLLVSPISAAKA
jgi:mannose-6-phosphate isomerase-like protein (cupin superfamily)